MKNRFIVLLGLTVFSISCTQEISEDAPLTGAQQTLMSKLAGGSEGDIVSGTLLVKLDEEAAASVQEAGLAVLADADISAFGNAVIRPAIPVRMKNPEAARRHGLHQWFTISFDEDTDPQKVAEAIAPSSSVRLIQYSRHIDPVWSGEAVPMTEIPATRADEDSDLPFNDTYLSYQWNLINDGTIHPKAVAGADVGVKDAWRLCAGDPSVVVAVFDLGINDIHEDLRDALWKNSAEVRGNGIDDDGNGFIDDIHGFNFFRCKTLEDGTVKASYTLDSSKGSGHGTHVAGIIGAVNGNGKGVSSIAGGTGNKDGVRLMSCQIFYGDNGAKGTDEEAALGFIYAADNGACIAQCSWGHTEEILKYDQNYIDSAPLEYAALQYFLDAENSNHPSLKGNIAVFAAGNQGNPYSIYPGALKDIVSVTAIDCRYLPAGYSNYGPGCKIAAPGGEWLGVKDDYSTMILSTGKGSQHDGTPSISNLNHQYVFMYGTSMACPHISGVLALGIAYAQKLGKTFTREEMTSLLLTSVNDIDGRLTGTKEFYTTTTSFTDLPLETYKGKMGTGAIDAWKFLMAIEGTPSVMVKSGEKASIDLSAWCNPEGNHTLSIDDASRKSLGITGDPVISGGRLDITCTAIGAGKIVISGSVGKDQETEGGIGGMNYSREISIVSRPFVSSNGGWF